MIFITVGSQKFQFDRLLAAVDRLIADGVIVDEVFAQIGVSQYEPQNYESERFLDREKFGEIMGRCNVVITHGGTGVIIGAVKQGKKVIAVPRLAKYGEHVDDHQLQLLQQFEELELISVCYDMEKLGECYRELRTKKFRTYISNTHVLIDSIDGFIQMLDKSER